MRHSGRCTKKDDTHILGTSSSKLLKMILEMLSRSAKNDLVQHRKNNSLDSFLHYHTTRGTKVHVKWIEERTIRG
jgi:hypothetical protein